jgi:hypothetical protein
MQERMIASLIERRVCCKSPCFPFLATPRFGTRRSIEPVSRYSAAPHAPYGLVAMEATNDEAERNRRTTHPKRVLRLLDLEHARTAVLNSLSSPESQRGYRHAIDEFADWYCSEPRLAFNRIVVLRYRSHLESRRLAPGTINLRLGAVRRLAYEAADCGLLSSDLPAGIRRVKVLKKNGRPDGKLTNA